MSEVFQRGGSAAAAAKKLVSEAKACWERDEGEYCDDITCVVVDLQRSAADSAAANPTICASLPSGPALATCSSSAAPTSNSVLVLAGPDPNSC